MWRFQQFNSQLIVKINDTSLHVLCTNVGRLIQTNSNFTQFNSHYYYHPKILFEKLKFVIYFPWSIKWELLPEQPSYCTKEWNILVHNYSQTIDIAKHIITVSLAECILPWKCGLKMWPSIEVRNIFSEKQMPRCAHVCRLLQMINAVQVES